MNGIDDDTLRDEALERRLEWGIREAAAGERAPDVAHAVLARLAAAAPHAVAGVAADARPPRTRGSRWLAAAIVLLGVSAVVGAFVATRPPRGGDARHAVQEPQEPQEPQDPQSIATVTDAAQIATLPVELKAVELRNQDDAALAALVARCPKLERLRIVAAAWPDGRTPVSITDDGLREIVGLRDLRRLELIGTKGIAGTGLRGLAALPALSHLALAGFDTDGEALSALSALPSLRVLDLAWNQGFGEQGLQNIARCPDLRSLRLHACSQLRSGQLRHLSVLPRLQELDLRDVGAVLRFGLVDGDGLRAYDGDRLRAVPGFDTTNGGVITRGREYRARPPGIRVDGIQEWPRLVRIDLAGGGFLEPEIGLALRERCPALQQVDLSNCPRIDDSTVADVVKLAYLRSLDLGHCPQVSRASLDRLLGAPRLREIGLDGCTWLTLEDAERLFAAGKRVRCERKDDPQWNAALQALAQRHAERFAQPEWWQVRTQADLDAIPDDVTHVDLRGLGDSAVAVLAKLSDLRGFAFVRSDGGERLTDDGLRLLARSTTLETVELCGAVDLGAGSLALLAPLGSLRSLRVVDGAFDDSSVRAIAVLPQLERLELVGVRAIGDGAMLAIATCTRLRFLSLNHCEQLGAASLARLGNLVNLESLHLRDLPALDDGVLAATQRMTRLRDLQLGEQSAFTTAGLANLPPTLQELGIDHCTGLDAGAGKLLRDRCPELRTLSAAGNPWLDDTALAAILELPRLADLTIHACRSTTAASLPALRGATSLRRLAATGAPWLTAEVVAALQGERPDLRIEYKVW